MPKISKSPQEKGARELRADASRNREKLLEAAERVFKEKGADASLDDVAKRAKVGIGTLYRHFPTREALLAAACDERLLELAARSHERDSSDTGAALAAFLEQLVIHASVYRGLAASLGVVLRNGSSGCHAATEAGERLLARAQASGAIRRDIAFDDVVCMATAISLAAADDDVGKKRIPRLVAMFVDGMRAKPTKAKSARSRSV